MATRVQQTQLRLGKTIQRLRKAHGWTQEAFAEKLHISRTHMGHIEQGRAAPSLKLLDKLAKALNVPVSELF
jgi:transcriptional regulator with XRE-family HTH domain